MAWGFGVRSAVAWMGIALAAVALAQDRVSASPSRAGAFRVRGSARVSAGAALTRTVDVRAGVVLQPGAGPRDVRLRVEQGAYACELAGELREGGALAFAPGQRCALQLQPPDGPGHVELELVSGAGRLAGEHLALELACKVSGSVSLQAVGLQVLANSTVRLPTVPVRGDATASAEGDRDHSTAAQR